MSEENREAELVEALTGATLIEQGAGWVKVHGLGDNAPALANALNHYAERHYAERAAK